MIAARPPPPRPFFPGRAILLSLALLAPPAAVPVARADALPKSEGTLHLVTVTVNQEGIGKPGPEIDSYNWCGAELITDFKSLGSGLFREMDVQSLMGAKATRAQFFALLKAVKSRARPKDIVVFYMGMHGGTEPREGWSVELAGGQGVTGKEVKELLGQFPCQVLCLVETCGSGGFAKPHRNDIALPPNCTAICCCRAKQTATNELDISVSEALHGRADFDRNGLIQLAEVTEYVQRRFNATWAKDGAECVIVSADNPTQTPLTKVAADLVSVSHDGTWYSGRLVATEGGEYRVRNAGHNNGDPRYGWNLPVKVTRDQIVLPGEEPPLMVEQNGQWYCAKLLSREGRDYKVKYVGYDEEETVAPSRVKIPAYLRPGVEDAPVKRRRAKNG